MAGQLKERKATKYIRITKKELPKETLEENLRHSKQAGYMFFPYHYLITPDGGIHKTRPEEAVSFGEVPHYDETISILCDTTQEALIALETVLNALKETYKGVSIKNA